MPLLAHTRPLIVALHSRPVCSIHQPCPHELDDQQTAHAKNPYNENTILSWFQQEVRKPSLAAPQVSGTKE